MFSEKAKQLADGDHKPVFKNLYQNSSKKLFNKKKTQNRNTVNASRLTNHFEDVQISPAESVVSMEMHKSYGSTTEVYINKFHESSV